MEGCGNNSHHNNKVSNLEPNACEDLYANQKLNNLDLSLDGSGKSNAYNKFLVDEPNDFSELGAFRVGASSTAFDDNYVDDHVSKAVGVADDVIVDDDISTDDEQPLTAHDSDVSGETETDVMTNPKA